MTVPGMLTDHVLVLVLSTDGDRWFWVTVPRLKNASMMAETSVKC